MCKITYSLYSKEECSTFPALLCFLIQSMSRFGTDATKIDVFFKIIYPKWLRLESKYKGIIYIEVTPFLNFASSCKSSKLASGHSLICLINSRKDRGSEDPESTMNPAVM